MALPKRFPDRDEIAAVRAEAEQLEPGATDAATKRRLAGRVMARRDMGKLVFLDLVDRSGRIQLICPTERTGELDLHLGDIVGRDRLAGAVAPRRAVAAGGRARGARADPRAAARHVPRHRGRRAALPQALSRPADERGVARRRDQARADGLGDPRLPRRRGLPRGRDADPAAALRRRLRRAVRHALRAARRRSLPPHRRRALPQAAHRRRAREGLRARRRTSATRATRTSTRRSSRRSSGTRRTPTTRTRPRG